MTYRPRSPRLVVSLATALALAVTPAIAIPVWNHAGNGFGNVATASSEATITQTKWLSKRHVALWVKSPVMKQVRQVQLIVPTGFASQKKATYPALYLLDGMRAATNFSGWVKYGDAVRATEDYKFITVLPIGGASSFYTNWQKSPEKGNAMQWETFLTKELPTVLQRHWRLNGVAGVAGLSMGGTAAVNLAHRHPDLYRFVGSYSGYLDTTSKGMAKAIDQAMQEVKPGYRATDMWGPYNNANWRAHDPHLHTSALKGTSIYVSTGTGNTGRYDKPGTVEGIPDDTTAYALEWMAHTTTSTFVKALRENGIPATVKMRPNGTHSWPYWRDELRYSLPQIAKALNAPAPARVKASTQPAKPACTVHGDIAKLLKDRPDLAKKIGPCTSNEYEVKGGRAQNFARGRAFWSPETGAHVVYGDIDKAYAKAGSAKSALGLPVSEELDTRDRKGRWQKFQHGHIVWTADNHSTRVYTGQ